MFQNATAAIDGSPASFHAAIVGAQLVSPRTGSLQLVCVAEGSKESGERFFTSASTGDEKREEILVRCEADLSSAQAAIGTLATVQDRKVLVGRTADALLEFATANHADLLCVGRGRHRINLGSVSSAIVRKAEIPVVVVPAGVSTGPRLRRLLLGFDGSDHARRAAVRVGRIASELGAKVRIDFVLAPPWPLPPEGMELEPEDLARLAGKARGADLDEASELVRGEGGEVEAVDFELGDPAERLLDRADSWNADLIVVGARGQSPARRFLLGGVSDKLTSRSAHPILIFR